MTEHEQAAAAEGQSAAAEAVADSTPQAAAQHEEARLEEGVRLVYANFRGLLEREGLAEIETEGSFDPHVHEALVSLPSEHEEGTIVEVHQKGYRLGDQVLRPARVAVA